MGLRAALAAFAVCCLLALAASAPTVFDTETEVYPDVQFFDDGAVLLQITDQYEMMLHQNSVLPPRVLIRTFENGEPVDKIMRTTKIRKDTFTDDHGAATVMIRRNRDTNRTTVVLLSNNATLADDIETNEVTKRDMENRTLSIRPEVVIISDSMHNRNFKTRGDLIRYIGIFMNAVNLRYATATGIDIQMKLTAIVVSTPDQETYIKYAGNYVNADQTIAGLTLRLASGYIPGNFDMAYLLTGRGSHNCLVEEFNYPLKLDKRLPGEALKPIDYCRIRFPEIPYVWTDGDIRLNADIVYQNFANGTNRSFVAVVAGQELYDGNDLVHILQDLAEAQLSVSPSQQQNDELERMDDEETEECSFKDIGCQAFPPGPMGAWED
ncbi:hypothetical protein V5799_007324 [Amblyomma americanum]|uniref:Secreted metalloprotease n=1 Tax=Amblyomma americanum TaxID=6943 RepID=A0AAQ4DTV5_AMBAM